MATQKTIDIYFCDHCGKEYQTREAAEKCEKSHDLVLIKISRADLNRLDAFISTGNPEYLTSSLVGTIRRYNRIRLDEE